MWFCKMYILQLHINSLLFHINLVSGDCMHKHDPEAVWRPNTGHTKVCENHCGGWFLQQQKLLAYRANHNLLYYIYRPKWLNYSIKIILIFKLTWPFHIHISLVCNIYQNFKEILPPTFLHYFLWYL